jgi:DNA-binding transcriptional LysR family regulator
MHAMNIAKLDLNLLVVFDALMYERNVTRAAHRVFLSQPAMSHALKRLRIALGDPLFVRNGRDMTPTPRAESLITVVRPLLEGFTKALHGPAFSPARLQHTFRLGLPDIAEFAVVPGLLRLLATEAPRVKLALHDLDVDEFQSQLARGELDAAVIADVPLRPGMHRRPLVREEHVVALMRRDHPAASGRLTLPRLRQLPRLAVTLSGGRVVSPIEHSSLAHASLGEVMVWTPHITSAGAILLNSDLILVIGELAGETLASLYDMKVMRLPVKLPAVESSLVWHERTHRDAAQRWFRNAVVGSLHTAMTRFPSVPANVSRAGGLSGKRRPSRAHRSESDD